MMYKNSLLWFLLLGANARYKTLYFFLSCLLLFFVCLCKKTGDIVLKPAWGRDQPNNYNGEQNCVVLDGGRNWLWNDVGCNLDYLHFICQHGESLSNCCCV